MQQLIDEDSKSPNVSFWAIDIVDEALRRHVDGRPNVNIFEFGPGGFGKSEICDFSFTVMYEYVGNFDISMDNTVLSEVNESFEDCFDIGLGFRLGHKLGLLQFRL